MSDVSKKKRNSGPFMMAYTMDGKEHSRLPDKATGVMIKQAHGDRAHEFGFKGFNDDTMMALATLGLRRTVETYVRNNVNKVGDNAIDLAAEVIGKLAGGSMFSRSSRSSQGYKRVEFDRDFWEAVAKKFIKDKTKVDATEQQLAAFLTRVESIDSRSRIGRMSKDLVGAAAISHVQAQRRATAARAVKSETGALDLDALFAKDATA